MTVSAYEVHVSFQILNSQYVITIISYDDDCYATLMCRQDSSIAAILRQSQSWHSVCSLTHICKTLHIWYSQKEYQPLGTLFGEWYMHMSSVSLFSDYVCAAALLLSLSPVLRSLSLSVSCVVLSVFRHVTCVLRSSLLLFVASRSRVHAHRQLHREELLRWQDPLLVHMCETALRCDKPKLRYRHMLASQVPAS